MFDNVCVFCPRQEFTEEQRRSSRHIWQWANLFTLSEDIDQTADKKEAYTEGHRGGDTNLFCVPHRVDSRESINQHTDTPLTCAIQIRIFPYSPPPFAYIFNFSHTPNSSIHIRHLHTVIDKLRAGQGARTQT